MDQYGISVKSKGLDLFLQILKLMNFESIMWVYSLYFSFEQTLLKTKVSYYQNVSYSIVEPNGDYQYVKLCVGEAVAYIPIGNPHLALLKEYLEWRSRLCIYLFGLVGRS